MRPYQSVRVTFSNSDYDNVCDTYGGGSDLLPAWRDLGDLLAHRPGWHFDVVNDGEALWSLGVFGESLLNIHVNPEGAYYCHDHVQDEDAVVADTPGVETWLSNREDEAKKPSAVLLELVRADDWRLLKSFPFILRVSWSDDYYAASLSCLSDASFGRTLTEAISGAGEMICSLFAAPTDIAPQLTISADMDETATAQIRSHD